MSALGAVDIGGSHVSAAIFVNGTLGPPVQRVFQRAPRSASTTLDEICQAMTEAGAASRWTAAVPGPFDYVSGVSLITGLDKLDELYEINVKAELTKRMPGVREIQFVNDAHAAGLGEWAHGAGRRADRMLFVGLGTGLGSAFIEQGRIIETGPLVPPDGHLGLTTFLGKLADDQFSTRGLLIESGYSDAAQLTSAASRGSTPAVDVLCNFGRKLEGFLLPWCDRFAPDSVVLGGGLSNAYQFICTGFTDTGFRDRCVPAASPDIAALYGISVLRTVDE